MAKNSYALIGRVLDASEAKSWEKAVDEWEIVGYREDSSLTEACICGKENLRYLFTIRNIINGNILYPIGSSCIKKFEHDALADELQCWQDYIRLKNKIRVTKSIALNSIYFTRRLLKFLYIKGAFQPNKYNGNDPRNDYEFMVDMFNKRDKSSLTQKQEAKVGILLRNIGRFVELFDPMDEPLEF